LSNQRGDVIGQRALRDERLDLRRGTVECGWVVRSGLCRGGQNRLGETVRAYKAAIGVGGDLKTRRHGQTGFRHARQRCALAANQFERRVGAVQFENKRTGSK
jgi:hypothetical protein